jgi:hypothetical protein
MRKFILLPIFFISVGIFAQANFGASIVRQTVLESEEYVVYKALLKQMFISENTKRLIIDGLTEADNFYNDYPKVRKKFTSRFKGTTEDFITKNTEAYELNDKFNLEVKLNILNGNEREELFKELNKKGSYDEWAEILSQKYSKGGAEIIRLSRVGFNADKSQALVFVSFQCGWTCGEGNYVLLAKKEGQWKVKKKDMTWIS